MPTNPLRRLAFRILVTGIAALVGPVQVFAVTDTWDGGGANDSNLSTGANWTDDTAPLSNLSTTDLIFAGGVRLTPNVSAGFSTRSITFNNTAGIFVIGGLQLNVGAGGIVNNDTETMTFNNLVSFSGVANATINAAAGGLTLTNTVTLPTGTLTVNGIGPTSFINLSGTSASALNKTDAGTMTWTPNITTAFNVTIAAGVLTMGVDGGADVFGSTSTIAVNSGSLLNINESLTLDGAQFTRVSDGGINIGPGKTLTVQNGGDAILTGSYSAAVGSILAVTGAGSTFSTTSALNFVNGSFIGGSTTANISAGGSLSSGAGPVSIATNASGLFATSSSVTVTGIGSSFSGGDLNLGSKGTATFSNGSTGTFAEISLSFTTDSGLGSAGDINVQSGAAVTGTGLSNRGVITITGANSMLTLTGAATAVNGSASTSSGRINVQSGGTFNSGTGLTTANATSVIALAGGTFNANGDLTLNGGQLTRDATGVFALDDTRTLTVQAGGEAVFTGAYTNSTASTITVTGVGSTFSTSGALGIESGSTLNVAAGGSVSVGVGQINSQMDLGTLSGNASVSVIGAGSALTVSFNGTANIGAANASTGTLNVETSGAFNSGAGLTTVNPTGTVAIADGTFNANGDLTLNGGRLTRDATGVFALDAARTLTVQAGGDAVFTGAYSHSTASTINVTGVGSTFSTTSFLSLNGGSTTNISAGGSASGTPSISIGSETNGTVTVTGTGSRLNGGTLDVGRNGGTGLLTFSSSSAGTFNGISVASGSFDPTNGTLNIQSGAAVTGTFLSLAPVAAFSIGTLTITGANSMLSLTTGGATIGAVANSTGTLNVNSSGTFTSGLGVTTVKRTGTIAINGGTFHSISDVNLEGGQLTRSATGVFTLDAARTLTLQFGGDAVFTGDYTNSTASTIFITDTGSMLSTTGNLGIQGGSVLNLSARGQVSAGSAVNIGTSGGNGTVTLDGAGSSFSGNALNIALNGNTGSLTLSNGSTGTFGAIILSASNVAGSNGTLNIQSGASITATSLGLGSLPRGNVGSVTIAGAGSALTLTGTATATIGATSNSTGTLNINSGGTFTTGTGTTNLNATGSINLNSGTLNLSGLLVVNGTLAITGSGAIQGNGSITKIGASTLTLAGTNSYTGLTNIDAGTVLVPGSLTGSIVNLNTGTLGGNGSISNAVTIGNGVGSGDAILAPGAGIATLTTGNASFASDGAFALEINSTTLATDRLSSAGTVSLGLGVVPLNLTDLGGATLAAGQTFTFITAAGGVTGTFAGLADGNQLIVGINLFTIDYTSNSVALVAVPEPAAATALFASLAYLVGLRRVRRCV